MVSLAVEEQVEIQSPFVVRAVQGTILSEGGAWPEGHLVGFSQFYLVGPGRKERRWSVRLEDQGKFAIDVPRGTYRFQLHVPGWTSYTGTVIVSRTARKDAEIRIIMEISA